LDAQERTLEIFESDEKFIAAAKELIEVRRTMQEAGRIDPAKAPNPVNLAEALGITIEGVVELMQFADSGDLGEFEKEMILSQRIATINDEGEIVR
jgi:hypothetical protein